MIEIIIFLVAMMIWCFSHSHLSDGLAKSIFLMTIGVISPIIWFFGYIYTAILIVVLADFLIRGGYI